MLDQRRGPFSATSSFRRSSSSRVHGCLMQLRRCFVHCCEIVIGVDERVDALAMVASLSLSLSALTEEELLNDASAANVVAASSR